ncbi:hypothetical protein RJ641_033862 [Dillenia turbinata]|uniref:Uncharacterized protein n=1 Tax=Dillenia turbinata TaxID=194707 RepID=A0AAN8VW27_9MAGN
MSGGVGPTYNDITLPKEDEQKPQPQFSNPKRKRRFLTFRQLNALAVMIVFAASGMDQLGKFYGFTVNV